MRRARAEDAPVIRRMIRAARLDPTSLDWRHFHVAEADGRVIGIGQVKKLPGCCELGSLVTDPAWRGRGVATALVHTLLAETPARPLYLLCERRLIPFYARFGFARIPWAHAPSVLRLKLLAALVWWLSGRRFIAMRLT
jgi:N-acetylglutamate synthase-like GNAT family acetyltransferase